MELQPILKNDLVRIRPLSPKDFKKLYQAASDDLIWEQHPDRERGTLSGFVNFFSESLKSKGALLIEDQKTGITIGSSRYKILPDYNGAVEIGWTFLSRKYWGGTYNASIKELMVHHAFKFVSQVILFVDSDNLRSQKAIEKLDFIRKDQLIINRGSGQAKNDMVYSINRVQ